MNLKKQQEALGKMQNAETDELYKAMMQRCIPVAKKVLKMIVDKDLTIGDAVIPRGEDGRALPMTKSQRPQDYQEVAQAIQQLMLDEDLLWAERHLVFALVKQPMDMLENITITDLDKTYQDGLCRMFGIEVFGELSFKQIDDFLKRYPPTKHADPVGAN